MQGSPNLKAKSSFPGDPDCEAVDRGAESWQWPLGSGVKRTRCRPREKNTLLYIHRSEVELSPLYENVLLVLTMANVNHRSSLLLPISSLHQHLEDIDVPPRVRNRGLRLPARNDAVMPLLEFQFIRVLVRRSDRALLVRCLTIWALDLFSHRDGCG